jgi:condensin complex subunit 1
MMRNGIIQLLGFLVAKAFTEDDKNSDGSQSDAREDLLNILEDRFRDVNSYTRSKVLQTWQYLYQQKCVPLNRVSALTAATVDRLRDKAAQPRKGAIQLLTTLLQYNPFGPSLRLAEFNAKLTELKVDLTLGIIINILEFNEITCLRG